MKLFDSNPENDTHFYFATIESFDGGMTELSHNDVTKSFNKAKKEAMKRLVEAKESIEKSINELEVMSEQDVYNRERF